jgi:hypothetical protein
MKWRGYWTIPRRTAQFVLVGTSTAEDLLHGGLSGDSLYGSWMMDDQLWFENGPCQMLISLV